MECPLVAVHRQTQVKIMSGAESTAKFPRRGEVWLLATNPIVVVVVVVSPDPRNKSWDSIIVVPLSTGLSNPHPKFHKAIPAGQGGLTKESHARCDLVSNLEKTCLDLHRGALGRLTTNYLWTIVEGIRASVGDDLH